MKITHLALANIKRSKSAAISLFILIFIAAMLLNIGMTIITQLNSFYDQKVDQLHDPHVSILMNSANFQQSYGEYLNNYSGVKETETEEIILLNSAEFLYGESELNSAAVLLNTDVNRSFSPFKLVEKLDTIQTNDIYLPYIFKTNAGYKLGDRFTLSYQDKGLSYRVAGFFEVTMMGTHNMGIMKFFLTDTAYRELSSDLGEQASGILMSAILTDRTESSQLIKDYNKQFPRSPTADASQYVWDYDIETIKNVSTMTINIVAMILVAFAVVIVLVSLIVIKFRITNTIEDGLVNIGVLKAMGYKSKEVLASIVMQFMLITLSASVAGVAVSYAVMPVFGGLVSTLTGLIWTQTFDVMINLFSMLIIIGLVLMVAFFSTLRIRKLVPVVALRGGIHTHSFRKNHIPLEKSGGSLHFLLSMKTMISNGKQNIMIALIIAAITFASVFSIVLYYNIAADNKAFLQLVGAETSNVVIYVKSDTDGKKLLANIEQMDAVEKVTILDTIETKIDGQSFYTNISDHYSKLNTNTVYEGRYPKYDNEIVITWPVSKQLNKGIGDTVQVETENASYSYLITGLSQSLNNMGLVLSVTVPGIQHLIPDYEGKTFNVYIEGTDNATFIQSFKAQYGDLVDEVLDVDKNLESQTGVYVSSVFVVMVVILATTMLVVIMILYLVIKTMILKRKKEFGILKAIGYTTFQLMNQIVMSFIPIVIAGVLIGGVLGYLYTNSMLTLLLSSAGIRNVQFIVDLPLTIILSMGIVLLAYLVSLLVSRRIKKISAYSLITE